MLPSEPHVIAVSALGQSVGRSEVTVTARQLMAYAAGISATRESYFADVPLAPPAFVVVLEWALLNGIVYRQLLGATQPVMERAVHLTQATRFSGAITAGMRVVTTGHVAALRQARRGVVVSVNLVTANSGGSMLAESTFVALILDAVLDHALVVPPVEVLPEREMDNPERFTLEVPAGAAHVYTECSGIWNPIHTERPAARQAGFDTPIVHGTWTWAQGMEWAIDSWCDGDPGRLAAWSGRFVAPVLPGQALVLSGACVDDRLQISASQNGRTCLLATGEIGA